MRSLSVRRGVPRRHLRSAGPVLLLGIALSALAACRTPGGTSTQAAGHEASVKPGINDPYKNAKVDEWIERFEGESREIYTHRARIAETVGLRRGLVVADIGAGTGLYTMMFGDAVGPSGKVFAVDITPEFIDLIDQRAREHGLSNVKAVLCVEDSVKLERDSVDVAFVCDTYHHFEYPKSTLRSIHDALRPGGELIVVDFERVPGKSRQWVLDHVRAGREEVIREIEFAGFALTPEQPGYGFLEENYILRFRKTG